jgi:hypothetical protein
MSTRAAFVAVALVATTACATTGGAQRPDPSRFVGIALAYERQAAAAPTDATLRAHRDVARATALTALASRARDERLATGAPSQAAMTALLTRRNQWPGQVRTWAAVTIAEEVAVAGAAVATDIRARLATAPLIAKADLEARVAALPAPELAALFTALGAEVRAAGQARCRAVAPADFAAQPHLARLAALYCASFGVVVDTPAQLPGLVGGVRLDGTIRGMAAVQRARLDASMDTWLRASPWYDAGAPVAAGTLGGGQAVSIVKPEAVRDSAASRYFSSDHRMPYPEPYVETFREEYQEPYREAYQVPYPVQVPYTTYVTERVPCGDRTCLTAMPRTELRSEIRYRTAYRTKYRTRTRMISRTRYRAAYRMIAGGRDSSIYRQSENLRAAHYRGTWSMTLDIGPAPIAVTIDLSDAQVGYHRDATFEPDAAAKAGDLETIDTWSERLVSRLGDEVRARLTAQWRASFCREGAFTSEAAARCARGGEPPPAARAALTALFGADTARLLSAFSRR